MPKEMKMECIACPYYHRHYGCQAVKKVCQIPALKNDLHSLTLDGKGLVITERDLDKILDDCVNLEPVENTNPFLLQPLLNTFGE